MYLKVYFVENYCHTSVPRILQLLQFLPEKIERLILVPISELIVRNVTADDSWVWKVQDALRAQIHVASV